METVLSVGIDIGTATTQMVFSEIDIDNLASVYMAPKVQITGRRVVYKSKIYLTPLVHNSIDFGSLKQIIDMEYEKANIRPEMLSTGAIIITGESSAKKNAREVVELLGQYSGNFVAAVAGPELEAVLAGKGAGADRLSKNLAKTTANIDIGGGTANIALFRDGMAVDAVSLDIGGRHVVMKGGVISYVSHKLSRLCDMEGINLKAGGPADIRTLQAVAGLYADCIYDCLKGEKNESLEWLYTNEKRLNAKYAPQTISFSGGVAECIYNSEHADFEFSDIGVLLGKAIKNHIGYGAYSVLRPAETIRATVIGVGVHIVEVSGSTIAYDESLLPMKNIPVFRIDLNDSFDSIAALMEKKLHWLEEDGNFAVCAICFSGYAVPSYKNIQSMGAAIIDGFAQYISKGNPVILIFEQDYAKALGQAMKIRLGGDFPLICMDCLSCSDGDFIDIGMPMLNGRVLPVVIKSLTFG